MSVQMFSEEEMKNKRASSIENQVEFANIDEYRLNIKTDCSNIEDSLNEVLNAIETIEAENGYLRQFRICDYNIQILVSKWQFENYMHYLESIGLFMLGTNMTGKSVQLTFAGIPVRIDTKLDYNEFEYLIRNYTR